jgi:carboxyl-terminal processing protease
MSVLGKRNLGGPASRTVLVAALACGVMVGGLAFVGLQSSPAQIAKEKANHRHVTFVVTSLLKKEHLSRRPIDDTISKRAFEIFLDQLDPLKIFFLQSDFDEFRRYENSIDDFVKSGDISVAQTILQRFLQRVDERTDAVDELLALEHDFALEETLSTDPDTMQFARNADEARELWRKRIKYELLVRTTDDMQLEEAQEKVARRYKSLAKRRHQTDSDELLEMFLTSVTSAFDPHTTFMSPSTHENFQINMKLNLEGIGAALKAEDGYTVITKVIPGGAADKQGQLKAEDRIVSVGQGHDGDMVEVMDMKLNDVVKMIRGHAGTVVRLGASDATGGETHYIEITRARIELTDSEARSEIVEEGQRADGSPMRIGVIDLPSFYMDMAGARLGKPNYKSTTRDVRRILDEFNAKDVDAVVLDLRRNGGGSLTEAINLTGLFIDTGPVVQVKDADGVVQHYDDLERGMVWNGPLVVLTSKFSASASEILAGAIQDYRRGLVIGDESTHGKGTVQSLLDLGSQLFRIPDPPNLGALKITMQQFYRPNGDSTQKRGVLADVALPSLTTHMDVGEGDLDYAIEFDRVNSAKFGKLNLVNPELLNELKARSSARRETSDDFQKLDRNIRRYKEQKERKFVTLNEERFRKEREELDADQEEEKQFEEQLDYTVRPVVERNFYFDEVLNIVVDYVKQLEQQRLAAK